jgi:hypothetical protein
VATTRGRHENRLYVATVDVIDHDDLDVSHGIPRIAAPSLQELTARIAARQPEAMLHDRDPNVEAAAQLAETTTAAELEHTLRDLDRLLDSVPNDQGAAMRSALDARRRLVDGDGSGGSAHRTGESLQQRIARLDSSIERLARRQREREAALQNRDKLHARRAVVADALAIRAFKDRTAARRSLIPARRDGAEGPAQAGVPEQWRAGTGPR